MKHTPGPWTYSEIEGFLGFYITQKAERIERQVATAGPNEADARLIAAAPDLLDALKFAYEHLESMNNYSLVSGARAMMQRAIAKAEGRE